MKKYQFLVAAPIVFAALLSPTPSARTATAVGQAQAPPATQTARREPALETQELTPPEKGVLPFAPNAVVRKDPETGQVRTIEGIIKVGGGSKTKPSRTAQLFVARQSNELLGPQAKIETRPVREINTPIGTRVILERRLNGLPVFENEVKVTTTKARDTVNLLFSELEVLRFVDDTTPTLGRDRAREIAIDAVRREHGVTDSDIETREQAGYLSVNGQGALTWRVSFDTREPLGAWQVVVDADTGAVLAKDNVARYATGRGMVFQPNPIQSTGDGSFTHSMGGCGGCDDVRLTNARVPVTLRELDGTGLLQGTYATTAPSAKTSPTPFQRASSPIARVYDYTRRDARFREVMAYFWVTENALYVARELDLPDHARLVKLDVNATTLDASQYSPDNNSLQFGTGGVPDAEDAEIILHEFAHAIQERVAPGLGPEHSEGRAMGEGFADYWAESFLERFGAKREWAVFFGKWDSVEGQGTHPAQGNDPPHRRRLDSTKHYPEDLRRNEHQDGEIWSACLWRIRSILGRERADKTILNSFIYLPTYATFSEGADAIINAHVGLYGNQPNFSAERDAVRRVFTERGIPLPSD